MVWNLTEQKDFIIKFRPGDSTYEISKNLDSVPN